MDETSTRTLERLLKIDFLSNIGADIHCAVGMCELVKVDSWQSAIMIRGSDAAANAFSEASGRLTRKLSAEFRTEYRNWNKIARENDELFAARLFAITDRRVDGIAELRTLEGAQQLVKNSIRWDLLYFASEQSYAALVNPAFYSNMIEVYEAGHFPCHWNEMWPNGKIWVL